MVASVLLGEKVAIPLSIQSLRDFRDWSRSADFPVSGRIDYLGGNIEVDISPENLFYHGTPKGEVFASILRHARRHQLGHVFVDAMRVVYEPAELSAEPDVVLVTQDAIDTNRVRLVEGRSDREDDYVEIEGAVDLVVEIVSDGSVAKDTQRLPVSYYQAGVREYWLLDARGKEVSFEILRRGHTSFEPTPHAEDGTVESKVLGCRCQLTRYHGLGGFWQYELTLT